MQIRDAFLDLIASFDCVKYLFSDTFTGPYPGLREVSPIPRCDQSCIRPRRRTRHGQGIRSSQEAPNLGVLHISDGEVNLHFEQFCEFKLGTGTPAH